MNTKYSHKNIRNNIFIVHWLCISCWRLLLRGTYNTNQPASKPARASNKPTQFTYNYLPTYLLLLNNTHNSCTLFFNIHLKEYFFFLLFFFFLTLIHIYIIITHVCSTHCMAIKYRIIYNLFISSEEMCFCDVIFSSDESLVK